MTGGVAPSTDPVKTPTPEDVANNRRQRIQSLRKGALPVSAPETDTGTATQPEDLRDVEAPKASSYSETINRLRTEGILEESVHTPLGSSIEVRCYLDAMGNLVGKVRLSMHQTRTGDDVKFGRFGKIDPATGFLEDADAYADFDIGKTDDKNEQLLSNEQKIEVILDLLERIRMGRGEDHDETVPLFLRTKGNLEIVRQQVDRENRQSLTGLMALDSQPEVFMKPLKEDAVYKTLEKMIEAENANRRPEDRVKITRSGANEEGKVTGSLQDFAANILATDVTFEVRDPLKKGAFIINRWNDGWYGTVVGPKQVEDWRASPTDYPNWTEPIFEEYKHSRAFLFLGNSKEPLDRMAVDWNKIVSAMVTDKTQHGDPKFWNV